MNLLDSYEDRFTYSFAFAGTASSIVQIILNQDFSVVLGEGFRNAQAGSPSYVVGKQIFQTANYLSLWLSTELRRTQLKDN